MPGAENVITPNFVTSNPKMGINAFSTGINTTMHDRGMVSQDHLEETIYCKSNGHGTNDVT